MSTLALTLLLLAPPADRSVEPIAIEAPPAEPTPAEPTPEPPPAADPFAAPTVQPQPATAPPPPPPPAPRRPDRPIRWRVDLVSHLGAAIHRDPGWRALDEDRLAFQPDLGLRADVRLAGGRFFLGGGAAFRRFAASGDLHGAVYTRTLVRDALLFLRGSLVAKEGLDVFFQLGGGPSVADLTITASESATQRSLLAMVDASAGLALYLPRRWLPRRGASRFSAGLELAAGYLWRSDLDVRPTVTTDDDPIDTTSTSFGHVSLRGVAWRFGLFLRFQ